MSITSQRSTKGVLRSLHKLTNALLEENSRLRAALKEANAQIVSLHDGLERLRRDVAARDRYDGEVRDFVATIIEDIQSHYTPRIAAGSRSPDQEHSEVRNALEDIHSEAAQIPSPKEQEQRAFELGDTTPSAFDDHEHRNNFV